MDFIKILNHLGVKRAQNQSPLLLVVKGHLLDHMVQMAFETLNVPALFLIQSSVASLYAAGVSTGCVIDVGYESTSVTIVFDAQVAHHSTTVIPIGGKDIDEHLLKLLQVKNKSVTLADCIKIKELYASCALSTKGAQAYTCLDYKLADGKYS